MSIKEKPDRPEKGGRRRSRKYSKLRRIGIRGGIGAGLVIAIVFLHSPKNEPWGLPAIPHNPRPATLPAELFTGQVAKVYRIVQEVPELLQRMPCYCGCYVNPGHRNNLDCYTDRHSVG